MLPGVYEAYRKDHSLYYRSSITCRGKHNSLGSYETEADASQAYQTACEILENPDVSLEELIHIPSLLSFEKIVTLTNYRDHQLYIGNPIYLKKGYFIYYLSPTEELKFDIDDLFYYTEHKILRRQGHLYVNDYGMQISLLSRYGIKAHAVSGRDYSFINGDPFDFRYANIEVINPYYGVCRTQHSGTTRYAAKIHINGNISLGYFSSAEKAAIAYNKAVDLARRHGINRNYPENYIESLSASEYADIYTRIRLSSNYYHYLKRLPD